ncbi:MAG: hypothetical protein L3K26_04815 [Candidatus Hydrogenedentes bacterium]|nr:hypothetical protein [Candidatus Hydrogenedentota bacterium]
MIRKHSDLLLVGVMLATQVVVAVAPAQPSAQRVFEADTSGDRVDLDALARAIEDLTARFPDRYPDGEQFLERLAHYEAQLPAHLELLQELRAFQREALVANPLVSGQPILFVVRAQYKSDHHNTATLFQKGEINTASFQAGGSMKTIDFAQGGKVETLIAVPDGKVRDPELHFSGQRIIFSLRKNIDDDYHIYEMNTDGTGLRQLTSAPRVSDIDPLYLPEGDIVFSSTREPKYCMCNRHIMANLYRMGGDGSNIHQIGKSTLFEGHGTLTPEGKILYYRWEYVDRNFGDAQALWTVNPDGTNHAVYWGNNTNSPGGVIDARPIPGTQQVLCIFGSCHDRPWGAVAIVDRRLGLDGKDPVVRTWPPSALGLVNVGDFDTFRQVSPKYEDPYPLDDTYFLCVRMTGQGEQMGIYLLDTFGNEIQLHVEDPGCFDPMPIQPRVRPPALPERRDFNNEEGFFFVTDVYNGTHMKGVERGSVKSLRVVESPEKRYWTESHWNGQGAAAPAMNWHDFNNKRILGTAPVHEDGSAYVAVPSDTFVYFQLLDENGMMIQSMRSGTIVQSGEVVGCVGCHDNRKSAPSYYGGEKIPLALKEPPAKLNGWYGEARLFNYLDEVQPVFDRNCVECHDYGNAQGNLNLGRDHTLTFNTSYNELWRKGLVSVPGAGPAAIQEARSWGSHASKLVTVLREGHHDVQLDHESMDRIVTWLDLNAPYYPRYDSAFPENLAGRAPLDKAQLKRLGELTEIPFEKLADFRTNRGPQISFDRPELSPCLQRFENKDGYKYKEALNIIRAGKAVLASWPRADMENFKASPLDQLRDEKYEQRRLIELANRAAIRNEKKVYDTSSNPDGR